MKKKLQLVCLCLPVLLSLCTQSFSQVNYYVATAANGGNDANAGTSLGAPFATIAKAISKAIVAGDTIFVRSGTYAVTATVKISKSGTAAKPIVLTVYKPDMVDANSRPVFDFTGMAVASGNRGFQMSNASYWNIYGIIIKGAGDNGMNIDGGTRVNIEFCGFTRNRDTGLQIDGLANHITVINSDAYENADLGAGTTTLGGNADGFDPKIDPGDTILFRGCRAWLNSDDGWDGYLKATEAGEPDNMTSFLEDCWSFRNGYYWLDGTTTTSENGNGFKLGGSDNKTEAHNFVVIKCLSFDNKGKGFDQNNSAGSLYLYNCTAYNNGDNDFGLNSSGVTYKAGAELVLENNLSLGPKGVSIPTASTATRALTTATNSFKKTTTQPAEIYSFDTTGVTAMRSIDGSLPVLNFMHLNSTAPTPYTYIDKGTVLSTVVYHGVAGVPYNGAAPDLGAFETLGTVPVKMLSFTAFSNVAGVTLNWKMANEISNKGWEIERSVAGNNSSWSSVGFVTGAGLSSVVTNYSYLDKDVLAGTYLYRLKQVDINGQSSYSNTILVKIGATKNELEIAAYPNPFVSSATIRYTVLNSSPVSLKIYNSQGQLVNALVEEHQQPGTYQKLINGQSLPTGKYFLKLIVGSKTITGSIIKE